MLNVIKNTLKNGKPVKLRVSCQAEVRTIKGEKLS